MVTSGMSEEAPYGAELQAGDVQGAAGEPSALTAFRIAEKRYQLHKDQVLKKR